MMNNDADWMLALDNRVELSQAEIARLEAEQASYDIDRELECEANAAREAFVMGLLHDAALSEADGREQLGYSRYAELADEGYIPGIGAPGDDMPD